MPARRLRLLAATGVSLAALALTACEDGTGTRDEGASRPSQPSRQPTATTPPGTDPAPPATSASGSGGAEGATGSAPARPTASDRKTSPDRTSSSTGSSSSEGSSSARGSSDPYAPANRALCNGSNTAVTAQRVSRPLNHMLITVRNTGSKVCDLTYFPVLRFDEMQWVPQAFEESRPQAVTTLAPGESGYAGVLLSAADGSGEGGRTGRKLTVAFQGRTPNSGGGASATPPLPARGVYYDSSLAVTYWQQDRQDALAY